jgi:5-methylcytosine-specific restriction endonuclease McrA
MRHQANSLFRTLRDRAYSNQGGKCYWCGEPMTLTIDQTDPHMLTGDHLVPYHNGGTTKPGNVVAACSKCNNERHPELNRSKKTDPQIYTHGDDRLRSPFEVLKNA